MPEAELNPTEALKSGAATINSVARMSEATSGIFICVDPAYHCAHAGYAYFKSGALTISVFTKITRSDLK
jgi:hypothetical protein